MIQYKIINYKEKGDVVALYANGIQWGELSVPGDLKKINFTIFPDEENSYFSFDYDKFMPVMMEAAQHLWKMKTGQMLPAIDFDYRQQQAEL